MLVVLNITYMSREWRSDRYRRKMVSQLQKSHCQDWRDW
jgi:hypothetical protein